MLRESLASSLVFDWKPNWLLSRKLFLSGESFFGLSILHGSWCRSVHLLHLSIFYVFLFLSSWKVNNVGSWIFIWNDPNQASMAWIASHSNQSLNPENSLKLYPSIRCSSIIYIFECSKKNEKMILIWFMFVCVFLVCFWVNLAHAFDFPIFLLNLELIWS